MTSLFLVTSAAGIILAFVVFWSTYMTVPALLAHNKLKMLPVGIVGWTSGLLNPAEATHGCLHPHSTNLPAIAFFVALGRLFVRELMGVSTRNR